MKARTTLVALLLLGACAPAPSPRDALGTLSTPPPALDPASVEHGRALYMAHCAECHGVDLAGAPDWKTPLPSGDYPPPPHDSTGHTWHHSDRVLIQIVMDPAAFDSSMPPTDLSRTEVEAVLDFIKSSWGPEERQFQWERTVADG